MKPINRANVKQFLLFEVGYMISMMAVLVLVESMLWRILLHLGKIRYLTNYDIYRFFMKPTTIVGFSIMLVFFMLLLEFQHQVVLAGADLFRRKTYSHGYVLDNAMRGFLHAIRPRNMGAVGMTFLLTLTMNLPLVFNMINWAFHGRKFIVSGVMNSHRVRFTLGILLFLTVTVAMIGVFSVNMMYDRRIPFTTALRRSASYVKKRWKLVAFTVIMYNSVILIILLGLTVGMTGVVALGVKILGYTRAGSAIYVTIAKYFHLILNFILWMVSIPACYLYVEGRFRVNYERQDQARIRTRRHPKKIVKYIIIVAVLLDTIFITFEMRSHVFTLSDFLDYPMITAHRGSSEEYPENTMLAFHAAVEEAANFIEIDVRQTKDLRFVVFHDSTLDRTCGLPYQVSEMTQQVLSEVDAGIRMDVQFQDNTIPTLEEVLSWAKDNYVWLNIELKPTKSDYQYVPLFYETLKEYGMQRQCVISSSNYEVLQELRRMDPNLTLGYILSMSIGTSYLDMDVDFFSVDYKYVTSTMIYHIHSAGKEIHIWTVNDEDLACKYATMGVDHIITDRPLEIRRAIFSEDYEKALSSVLDYIFDD
ncbi:MAG: glycerophosphoryl diester phosphodiesterase membrane domain-containing protein [Lachnospiraceae bacterium]|nr:glycerophosphoryl diester phosphodiesterase membrane domain-containing protein [Lachnospiraceae bacterium]